MQIGRTRTSPDLIDTALTIVAVLERNQITTYEAEKVLWAILSSVYLSEDDAKRSVFEVMDMIERQREILAEEIRLQYQVQEDQDGARR